MAITKVVNNGFGAYKASEADVKPSWGVERVVFNRLVPLEDGVQGILGDDRFRFVDGNEEWVTDIDPTSGVGGSQVTSVFVDNTGLTNTDVDPTVQGELVIDFFGNDINLVGARGLLNNIAGNFSEFRILSYVDNEMSPRSTYIENSGSDGDAGVISTQLYKANTIIPLDLNSVATPLAVGDHTVRIEIIYTVASGSGVSEAQLPLFGCEIINEKANTTGDVDISDGDIYSDGYRYRIENGDTNNEYPPIIPDGMLSGRGARVVTYLDPLDGTFGQVTRDVNSSQEDFDSADHSNEDIIRRVNFREFGANSPTDFSTLADDGVARAFTLDDGTTTLVADSIVHLATSVSNIEFVSIGADTGGQSANNFILTFVGTGLDVFYIVGGNNATRSDIQVFVDGFSIGTFNPGGIFSDVLPIVSGLAYGTHTVRFQALTSSMNDQGVSDFIIYGPKKPEGLPIGAIEIADYNIMADYAQTSATSTDGTTGLGGLLTLGTGLLRKMSTREFTYNGAWGPASFTATTFSNTSLSGFNLGVTNSNVYLEYTFFGTGYDFRFAGGTGTSIAIIEDPIVDVDGNFTPIDLSTGSFYGAGGTFTIAQTFIVQDNDNATVNAGNNLNQVTNGQMIIGTNFGAQNNSGFVRQGLPLGVHTIRVVRINETGVAGGQLRPRAFDVITPIHYQDRSLKVGSTSIGDARLDYADIAAPNEVIPNRGEAKAWVNYDTNTNTIASSYNISAIVETSGGQRVIVYFDKLFKDNSYICCPAIEPSGNTSAATIQIDRQPGQAGTRDSKTAGGCTLLSNSIGTFTCSFFGELIDE